jgi:hypothetical protein
VIVVQRRDITTGELHEEKRYDVSRMASTQDIDGLTEATRSSDPGVRRSAALALGSLGEWRATEPLIRALGDPVQTVREGAANALVMVGTPAVEPLIDLLERPDVAAGYEVPAEAPGEGITQVDLLGGPDNIPPTKRRLRHRAGIVQHDAFGGPEDMRRAGGRRALDEEAEITQHDLLGGPEDVGTRKALRHRELTQHDLFGGPEDAKEHEGLFPEARRAVVVTEGVPPGRGLRRAYAAAILGEIADPRAEEALARSVSDPDPAVRKAAEDGMARFRERRGEATPVPPTSRRYREGPPKFLRRQGRVASAGEGYYVG